MHLLEAAIYATDAEDGKLISQLGVLNGSGTTAVLVTDTINVDAQLRQVLNRPKLR